MEKLISARRTVKLRKCVKRLNLSRSRSCRIFALVIVTLAFVSSMTDKSFAWGFSAPASLTATAGATVARNVYVTGTIAGNPPVQLLQSPPTAGITANFAPNNQPAPFTSVMYVAVSASVLPGTYPIYIWAHPAGVPFPGPGNMQQIVNVIVGSPFGFLTVSPPSQTVEQGKTAYIQLVFSSGVTITFYLTGLGPGMTYAHLGGGRIAIYTSSSTPVGSYSIVVIANAGGITRQATAIINVVSAAPPFDFGLEAAPASVTVKAGKSGTSTVTARLVSGTGKSVSLSAAGLPAGASHTFSPSSGTPTFTSTLTITTDASVSPGTYPLTITGTGDSITRTTTINLVVEKAKTASSLTLSATPTTLKAGETVSVVGSLSPAVAATIELIYNQPDGFEMTKRVSTSSSGAFSDSFKPEKTGLWSVRAKWAGDEDREGSESMSVSFSVEPKPPSLWEQIPGGELGLIAIVAISVGVGIGVVALTRMKRSKPTRKRRRR